MHDLVLNNPLKNTNVIIVQRVIQKLTVYSIDREVPQKLVKNVEKYILDDEACPKDSRSAKLLSGGTSGLLRKYHH